LRLKCTKFRFRDWGSAPDPAAGAHSALPDPQLDLRGRTSKGREESGREKGRGRGIKGKGRVESGARTPSITNFWLRHCFSAVINCFYDVGLSSVVIFFIFYA